MTEPTEIDAARDGLRELHLKMDALRNEPDDGQYDESLSVAARLLDLVPAGSVTGGFREAVKNADGTWTIFDDGEVYEPSVSSLYLAESWCCFDPGHWPVAPS